MLRGAIIWILAVCLAGSALAQESPARATHGDWGVYRDRSGNEQICWVATEPIGGSAIVRRSSPVVLYTVSWGEFSFVLRRGSFNARRGRLMVGSSSFDIFFRDGEGWLRQGDTDSRALSALRGSERARLVAGDDELVISLRGFNQALRAARQMCGL
ncbi:MAG: hypothetical protein AAGK00_09950 [Pseudomonadota bacterium]